jgi:hypothetical protein
LEFDIRSGKIAVDGAGELWGNEWPKVVASFGWLRFGGHHDRYSANSKSVWIV